MANVNFKFQDGGKNDPIIFEQIFAEKPGGGMVANSTFAIKAGTAVGLDSNNNLKPIKAFRVAEDASSAATSIKIEKGSGIASGDIIGVGGKAVASTAVDTTNAGYDEVTVSLATAVSKGDVLYQAKAAKSSGAEAIYSPLYLIGNEVPANAGDYIVRLVNGCNIRKETAQVAKEVVALLKNVAIV